MKIEAGKFYRTRGGQKVRVYTVDGGGEYPVHAALLVGTVWYVKVYKSSGHLDFPDDHDLISEWVDKPVVDWSKLAAWHRWVARDERGEWFSFGQKPTIGLAHWMIARGCDYCPIPPQYSPTFSGDWKDSLVERPTE